MKCKCDSVVRGCGIFQRKELFYWCSSVCGHWPGAPYFLKNSVQCDKSNETSEPPQNNLFIFQFFFRFVFNMWTNFRLSFHKFNLEEKETWMFVWWVNYSNVVHSEIYFILCTNVYYEPIEWMGSYGWLLVYSLRCRLFYFIFSLLFSSSFSNFFSLYIFRLIQCFCFVLMICFHRDFVRISYHPI